MKISFKYQDSYECAMALTEGVNQIGSMDDELEVAYPEGIPQSIKGIVQSAEKTMLERGVL